MLARSKMFKFFNVSWIFIVCGVVASAAGQTSEDKPQRTYTYPCEDHYPVPNPLSYPYSGFIKSSCAPRSLVGGTCRHECDRECKEGDNRICYYLANIESTEAHNPEDCANPNSSRCIKIDGDRVQLETINHMVPGPVIAVCVGDTIVVDVANMLTNTTIPSLSRDNIENSMYANMAVFKVNNGSENVPQLAGKLRSLLRAMKPDEADLPPGEPTAIHWHGAIQKETPESDGVPLVTQDPICPECIFRYRFQYTKHGTFFWHSHFLQQRGLGMYAPIVIRTWNDPHASLIDVDSTKNTILITDHVNGNIILNSYGCLRKANAPTTGYISTFDVEPGKRTRFRFIANSIRFLKLLCWIESHDLLLIALDGSPIEPVTIKSFLMGNGDRVEVVINADQYIDNYAIHCINSRNSSVHQVAIIHYNGAPDPPDCSEADFTQTVPSGLQFNTENTFKGTPGTITISEVSGLEEIYPICEEKNVFQYHLELSVSAQGFQINNITFVPAKETLMKQMIEYGFIDESEFCNAESFQSQNIDCSKTTCSCTHVVKVPYQKCVEFVLYGFSHPFHMHGVDFYVVALVKDPDNGTLTKEKFLEMDQNGLVERNLINPPLKDTLYMPSQGAAVIRFYADNPGPWLAHCHVEAHNFFGMTLIFWVGPERNFAKNRVKNHYYKPKKNNYCV